MTTDDNPTTDDLLASILEAVKELARTHAPSADSDDPRCDMCVGIDNPLFGADANETNVAEFDDMVDFASNLRTFAGRTPNRVRPRLVDAYLDAYDDACVPPSECETCIDAVEASGSLSCGHDRAGVPCPHPGRRIYKPYSERRDERASDDSDDSADMGVAVDTEPDGGARGHESAAEVLADETGDPADEFEYDGEIPDLGDLDEVPVDVAEGDILDDPVCPHCGSDLNPYGRYHNCKDCRFTAKRQAADWEYRVIDPGGSDSGAW